MGFQNGTYLFFVFPFVMKLKGKFLISPKNTNKKVKLGILSKFGMRKIYSDIQFRIFLKIGLLVTNVNVSNINIS